MKILLVPSVFAITLCLISYALKTNQMLDKAPLRIIAFGAHPDDAELRAGDIANYGCIGKPAFGGGSGMRKNIWYRN